MDSFAWLKVHRKPLSIVLGALFLMLCSAPPALAQFDTGTVSGTTVDSTGAMVPNATVTVRNTETGRSMSLTTNGAGAFSATDLPFGTYTITATATGFGTTTSRNVVLNVGAA